MDKWPGWMTEAQFRENLHNQEALQDYEAFREEAFRMAREAGWEGDIREGPFISGLPSDADEPAGRIMIAWKQDNNGETFIVSPFALSWLE
jgi:hypothetical protein